MTALGDRNDLIQRAQILCVEMAPYTLLDGPIPSGPPPFAAVVSLLTGLYCASARQAIGEGAPTRLQSIEAAHRVLKARGCSENEAMRFYRRTAGMLAGRETEITRRIAREFPAAMRSAQAVNITLYRTLGMMVGMVVKIEQDGMAAAGMAEGVTIEGFDDFLQETAHG